ncbi:MAG: amino acid adenylation domain-containing protein [Lentilitoribacter sp.]
MSEEFNISNAVYKTATQNPMSTALVCDGNTLTYGEMWNDASKLASYLRPHLKNKRVGILGSRSAMAYIGIIGAAASGATYVPLNMKWPEERLIAIFDQLELDAVIVDKFGAKLMTEAVKTHAPKIIISSDDALDADDIVKLSDIQNEQISEPVQRLPEDLGYIIFTSGTTGMPKGVMVSNSSLNIYLDEAHEWCDLTVDDRVAEAHDLTFDLSVHNMFLAWRAGSALYIMSQLDMMAPQAFVRKHEITVWLSVPTIVNNVRRANRLGPNLFPSLRLSMFCGEPLPIATIKAMQEAAPNARIENIYGPTECTIVCSRQTVTNPPLITEQRDILAIGNEFSNTKMLICDEEGNVLPDGKMGEIALESAKLADGYFKAEEQTKKAFRNLAGRRMYFTGDLGYRDENGVLHYMGRTDNQIKMKGNRIELEEVDTHLRKAAGTELAAIVAWPILEGIPQGLVGFAIENGKTAEEIQMAMKKSLPLYMVPSKIHILADMPRNTSDKIDRKALREQLDNPLANETIKLEEAS